MQKQFIDVTNHKNKEQNAIENTNTFDINKFNDSCICDCGNLASSICIDKSCGKHAFICQNNQKQYSKCQSKFNHKNCFKVSLNTFTNKLTNKILNVQKLIQDHDKIVQGFIDKLIQEASRLKQIFKNNAERIYKYSNMSKLEHQILINIQENQTEKLKGQDFYKVFIQLSENKIILSEELKLKNIESMWKQIQILLFSELKKISSEFNQAQIKQLFQKDKQRISSESFLSSSIIKTIEDKQTLFSFFQKKINSVKLLYKASTQNFHLQKFYQNCTGIKNTLVLIQTQYDKKIGGFTPLCWKKIVGSSPVYEQTCDVSLSSFLFSLTQKLKFIQKNQKSGIFNYLDSGPMFGNQNTADLWIKNSANADQSVCQTDNGYVNSNFSLINPNNKNQKFSGNPSNGATVLLKQWEVWAIDFKQ